MADYSASRFSFSLCSLILFASLILLSSCNFRWCSSYFPYYSLNIINGTSSSFISTSVGLHPATSYLLAVIFVKATTIAISNVSLLIFAFLSFPRILWNTRSFYYPSSSAFATFNDDVFRFEFSKTPYLSISHYWPIAHL